MIFLARLRRALYIVFHVNTSNRVSGFFVTSPR